MEVAALFPELVPAFLDLFGFVLGRQLAHDRFSSLKNTKAPPSGRGLKNALGLEVR
jgi:hypothetical protein